MLPSLEVRQLHALVLLAEEMNFTRAANRLNVSQPALSKLVTELEEQYGLHLFNREKGRLIELTDAGQIFIEEARAVACREGHPTSTRHPGRNRKNFDGGALASL